MSFNLNYDDLVHLDAENLAEEGIGQAYESLLPELRKYVQQPVQIEEVIDNDAPSYAVKCGAQEFVIYEPELGDDNGNSWGRATYAFFTIVNDQLASSSYRFYAISGGNDLGGMFLTQAQAQEAQKTLPNKADWPYVPKDEQPWYGQYR
jgi:hypothetical protein